MNNRNFNKYVVEYGDNSWTFNSINHAITFIQDMANANGEIVIKFTKFAPGDDYDE